MPKTILSSSSKQKDTVFLLPWIEKSIGPLIADESDIRLPVFNFIPKLQLKDLRKPQLSPRILRNPSHFVKVVKFHSVNRFQVFATVRDSAHQILVEFTPQCVSEFERTHRSRITLETEHSLFIISDCKLYHRDRNYILKNFGIDMKNWQSAANHKRCSTIPVLIVNQASQFEMDQIESFEHFPYLYTL
ncbi:LOW QUALITY PROTEIN: telomerase subunit EST3 TDEL_0H02900 [Torulaspora delbrueckii]|uniref:Telomere replication protein EST3 n=1 Tax=Torulaspora delbrueckii TaxID=4950 RepID=G8ZZV5_TORDE|nr:LOW QUALITY PROTEIN: hypothetical protein TDEL_0H02900 [Torulaspora delbrueckii]CCE94149.1 hypothetical protein TDEL_0H02900 [Torulaspora delbrueckii]